MPHSTPDDSHDSQLNDSALWWDNVPLESATPLEASAPLDAQMVVEQVETEPTEQRNNLLVQNSTLGMAAMSAPLVQNDLPEALIERTADSPELPFTQPQQGLPTTISERETVRLLEERLIVDRKKRKIGDVVVRKVIETHIVEVPVRREKLIVEQISPEHKQLASIDLGEPDDLGESEKASFASFASADSINTDAVSLETERAVSAEFLSVKEASQFLATIAASQPELGQQKVQLRIVVESAESQQVYQQWLDRYRTNY